MDILELDATAQLEALNARAISAEDLLRLTFARADKVNPGLNAVVSERRDAALEEARAVDAARAGGAATGRLAGLPMTIKDTLDVEGLPASVGLAGFLGREAKDAAVVALARAEGAIVWGKTNTPVMAADWQTYNALYGVTNNPWDPGKTPGGSSGGSAVALAAGLAALEIGADIGGSLRIPASFCGVFAHKPTYGLVSQRGLVPASAADLDLAVVGPMARSARDLGLLLPVIGGRAVQAEIPPVSLKGLKVGLWLDEPRFSLDPQVSGVIEVFAARLAEAGAVVERVKSPIEGGRLMDAYTLLLHALTSADRPAVERGLYELLRLPAKLARAMGSGPLSWAQGVLGATARHRDWLQANEARAIMGNEMQGFFSRHDVLIAPICPSPPFAHDHSPFLRRLLGLSDGRRVSYLEMMTWVALATVCGLPATAIPAGLTAGGLPVGVQIIGPHGGDALTLGVGQAIEAEVEAFRPPPLALLG